MTEAEAQAAPEITAILARIDARLAALGIAESAASVRAFGHHKGIANLRRTTKSPGLVMIRKLAPVLEVSASWLAWGAGGEAPPPTLPAPAMPDRGEVAAGRWVDQGEPADAPPAERPRLLPDPRWPAAEQFTVTVRGSSIDRVAPHGSTLACAELSAIGRRPQDGELVIVERHRRGGQEIERSAKRLRQNGNALEFWPDSFDPAHRPIIADAGSPDPDVSVHVVAIVDRVLAPVGQARPWERFPHDQTQG